jgi:hypothetical protein
MRDAALAPDCGHKCTSGRQGLVIGVRCRTRPKFFRTSGSSRVATTDRYAPDWWTRGPGLRSLKCWRGLVPSAAVPPLPSATEVRNGVDVPPTVVSRGPNQGTHGHTGRCRVVGPRLMSTSWYSE